MPVLYAWKKRAELVRLVNDRGLPAGGACRDHFITQLVNDDNGWPQPVFVSCTKMSSIYSLPIGQIEMNLGAASLPTNGGRDLLIARLINHRLGNFGPQSGVFGNGGEGAHGSDGDVDMADHNDDDVMDNGDNTPPNPSDGNRERVSGEKTNTFANLSSSATDPQILQQTSATMSAANSPLPRRRLSLNTVLTQILPHPLTRSAEAEKLASRPSTMQIARKIAKKIWPLLDERQRNSLGELVKEGTGEDTKHMNNLDPIERASIELGPWVHVVIGAKKKKIFVRENVLKFYSIKYEKINGVNTITLPNCDPTQFEPLWQWISEEKVDCHIPIDEITPGVMLERCFEFIRLAAEIGIPRAGNVMMKPMKRILAAHSELLKPEHIQLIFKVYHMDHGFCELMASVGLEEYIRNESGGRFAAEFNSIIAYRLLILSLSKRNLVHLAYVHPLKEEIVKYETGPANYKSYEE